eukprot:CAMPEP_0172461670 /NCGR_PEP_ID=MMETSP1065-20121228/41373_1 /TAXON_ID=265537 /ORGANISM="Amphiprora paludosa, Strain CCMP125" /LENGTH=243 /DNA_ID=CAMNT_0013217085 /DNA_START=56 /DNA_END=787 /DNA_ORIENTATION=-
MTAQAHQGKPLPHWELFEKTAQKNNQRAPLRVAATQGSLDGKPDLWVTPDEDFWRENLEPIEYKVLRGNDLKSKEAAMLAQTASLHSKFFPTTGYFACRGCGLPLFSAESKFSSSSSNHNSSVDSPLFGCCIDQNVQANLMQGVNSHSSQKRADTCCARCQCHLGHVRAETNPTRQDPTLYFRERHVVHGLSLAYVKPEYVMPPPTTEDPGEEPKPLYQNDRAVVLKHPPVILNGAKPVPLYQ